MRYNHFKRVISPSTVKLPVVQTPMTTVVQNAGTKALQRNIPSTGQVLTKKFAKVVLYTFYRKNYKTNFIHNENLYKAIFPSFQIPFFNRHNILYSLFHLSLLTKMFAILLIIHMKRNLISILIATCSWKENWCWPGTCTNHLAKNCVCSNDFYKSSSNPARCERKSNWNEYFRNFTN